MSITPAHVARDQPSSPASIPVGRDNNQYRRRSPRQRLDWTCFTGAWTRETSICFTCGRDRTPRSARRGPSSARSICHHILYIERIGLRTLSYYCLLPHPRIHSLLLHTLMSLSRSVPESFSIPHHLVDTPWLRRLRRFLDPGLNPLQATLRIRL